MRNLIFLIPLFLFACKKETAEDRALASAEKYILNYQFKNTKIKLDSLKFVKFDTLTEKDMVLSYHRLSYSNIERLYNSNRPDKLDSIRYYQKEMHRAYDIANEQDSVKVVKLFALFKYRAIEPETNRVVEDSVGLLMDPKDYAISHPFTYLHKFINTKFAQKR